MLSTNGWIDINARVCADLETNLDPGVLGFFPPTVAFHLVKLACERPDKCGRSLSQWDCAELARELEKSGVVTRISPSSVRAILQSQNLKPWRFHYWLSPKHPRDQAFYDCVAEISDLYTRAPQPDEVYLCVDEKTSIQPRPRHHETKPAQPGRPNYVEHEYRRDGALNLFAGFDIHSGRVYGQCHERKRQKEFIAYLEYLDSEIPQDIKTIHIICDNYPTHNGKEVRKWLDTRPRFVFHFTPKHCSWVNQVEQWFSILQRKRFRIVDFESKADLKLKIDQFIVEWNQIAHPFTWTEKSFDKILAKQEKEAA